MCARQCTSLPPERARGCSWVRGATLLALALLLGTAPADACVRSLRGGSGGTGAKVRRAMPKDVRPWRRARAQADGTDGASSEDERAVLWGNKGSNAIPTAPLSGPPYRATGVIRPPHFVRGNDPEHPKMRIPVRSRDVAHTVNILPENAEWKDHDSDADEGHPNWPVIRLQEMNSSEISEDIWDKCKDTFDRTPWTDENYNATIAKYGLQPIERFAHLLPRLWFEPPDSEEERLAAEGMLAAEEEAAEGRAYVAHEGFPFCEKCGSMLGVARPDLGLLEDAGDARCRTCGFLNLHGPGGRLLNDAAVDLLELRPSAALWEQQAKDVDAFQAAVEAIQGKGARVEPLEPQEHRATTAQRCLKCGHKEAYYHVAQVRGADEGQTAFFECVRCGERWTEGG